MASLGRSLRRALAGALLFSLGIARVSAAPPPASAPPVECHSQTTADIPWKYCVSRPSGREANTDIAYYLHGLGQNGDTLSEIREPPSLKSGDRLGTLLADALPDPVHAPPVMVTFTLGPVWLFAPETSKSPGSRLMSLFVNTVIPEVEKTLGTPRHRLLVGASMGGFNASQLLLRHPELFDRVALLCPALSTVSPYASLEEISAYVRRTGAHPDQIALALGISRDFFPDAPTWDGASPFVGSRDRLGPQTPPLYVSAGMQDQFGFQEGAKAFADLAQAHGAAQVEWHPVRGGHCSFDAAALAAFLGR